MLEQEQGDSNTYLRFWRPQFYQLKLCSSSEATAVETIASIPLASLCSSEASNCLLRTTTAPFPALASLTKLKRASTTQLRSCSTFVAKLVHDAMERAIAPTFGMRCHLLAKQVHETKLAKQAEGGHGSSKASARDASLSRYCFACFACFACF